MYSPRRTSKIKELMQDFYTDIFLTFFPDTFGIDMNYKIRKWKNEKYQKILLKKLK